MQPLKKIKAFFYATDTGNEPVRVWLKSLDAADRKTIGDEIAVVEFGWPVGMPVCRALGNGLWEVRVQIDGNRNARILFAIEGEQMVLLHGFIKKSRKAPKQDLELAVKRWKAISK